MFSANMARRFHAAGLLMLRGYALLSRGAHLAGQARWQLKPQHHNLWHGFNFALRSRRNPRSYWLFRHEDFVGMAARIGRNIQPASLSLLRLACLLEMLHRQAGDGPAYTNQGTERGRAERSAPTGKGDGREAAQGVRRVLSEGA